MDVKVYTYFKWVISAIFVLMGFVQLFNPESTGDILIFLFSIDYFLSVIIVYAIAIIQILIGLGLNLSYTKNIAAYIIMIFSLMFFLISAIGYIDGWNNTCGCFQRFSFGQFDLTMIFRSLLLLIITSWFLVSKISKKAAKEINLKLD